MIRHGCGHPTPSPIQTRGKSPTPHPILPGLAGCRRRGYSYKSGSQRVSTRPFSLRPPRLAAVTENPAPRVVPHSSPLLAILSSSPPMEHSDEKQRASSLDEKAPQAVHHDHSGGALATDHGYEGPTVNVDNNDEHWRDGWDHRREQRVLRKMDIHLLPFVSLLYLLSFL